MKVARSRSGTCHALGPWSFSLGGCFEVCITCFDKRLELLCEETKGILLCLCCLQPSCGQWTRTIGVFCLLFSQYRQGSKRKSRPVSVKTFEDVPLVTTVKVVQEVSLSLLAVVFPPGDVCWVVLGVCGVWFGFGFWFGFGLFCL